MNNFTVKRFEIEPPIPYNTSKTLIGIDPGTKNLGIAIIRPSSIVIYQIEIERSKYPLERINTVKKVWNSLQTPLPYEYTVVIEDAAYEASRFRQVELAECRVAFAIELSKSFGVKVEFIKPNSIRKTVFGNGRMKAHEVWTDLYDINTLETIDPKKYPDALAALSCAYYGVMTYE